MSYFYIFCQSKISVSSGDLIGFIQDGIFFEEKPQFVTESNPDTSAFLDWKAISVAYDPDHKPIIFANHEDDELFKKITSELLFILSHPGMQISTTQQKILKMIKETIQIFTIQLEREDVTEDAWEMLDCIESYIAEKCDGLIYAPDDFFYDARLKKIYHL